MFRALCLDLPLSIILLMILILVLAKNYFQSVILIKSTGLNSLVLDCLSDLSQATCLSLRCEEEEEEEEEKR